MWDGAAWPLCCPPAAMGVQPCALPTALLSTHTGGLGRPARTDESGFISAALAHYAQLGLAFDCVYSGYLAGAAQVALVEQAFRQAPAALKLVDPVMADHGRPYASMTPEIRAAVAQLCGQADVIVPNATEAALLLEELPGPAADGTRAARHASLLLQRFPALRCAVVTGGGLSDGQRGTCALCAAGARFPALFPRTPRLSRHGRSVCRRAHRRVAARLFRSRRHPSRRAFCGAGG